MSNNGMSDRYSPHGNGYIKIHRKLLTSAVFQSENLLKVWMWCLLRANWHDTFCIFEGKELRLARGQFITGRYSGSKECSMNPKTFYNQLIKLANFGNLVLKSDNKKTLIIIVNYDAYQDKTEAEGQQEDNKRTTGGQQEDTDKEVKNQRSKEKEARPQSLSAVIELFKEKEYIDAEIEAEKFWNYYESNGWRVGKNAMKNWKSSAAGWNSRAKQYGGTNGTGTRNSNTQHARATFKHGEAEKRRLAELEATLEQRDRERNQRSEPD